MKTSFWRVATAVFAAGSIIYTTVSSNKSRGKSKPMKQAETEPEFNVPTQYQEVFDKNLIIPAGWAFGAVWSTVYTGLAALMVHQALPGTQNNPRYQKALPWWLASWTLNALFGRYFSQNDKDSIVISDLTTKVNLGVALGLHHALEIGKTDVPAPEKYLRIPVSLYTGWLTAATVVGTPDTLLTLDVWKPDTQRDELVSAAILSATGGLGYLVARHLNDPWYLLPFVAGFGGIATRQWDRHPIVARKAAGWAVVYAGLLAYWLPKGKFREYDRTIVNENAVGERFQLNPTDVYNSPLTSIDAERMTAIEAEGLD